MMDRLTWHELTLKLRNPFRIAYGASETRQAFWLRLAGDEGWGEGTIPSYYHVTPEAMQACWQAAAHRTDPLPEDLSEISAWIGEDGPAPARCAIDLALHDRLAQRAGVPLYRLLGLPRPEPLPTSFTISIAPPEEMAQMARQVAEYPVIKVKLGGAEDEACLAAIRQARPDARLRVDANAGWSPAEAVRMVARLEPYDLEMIEQPVPKTDIEGLGFVQKHTRLPVVADESLQSIEDVDRLARAGVQAINLKLMKVGGIGPGLRILQRARSLGMRVMLGCMIETSLGTTAMAHLAGLADWLDLDAPMLIANDPFRGLQYDAHAGVHLSEQPGIGVTLI